MHQWCVNVAHQIYSVVFSKRIDCWNSVRNANMIALIQSLMLIQELHKIYEISNYLFAICQLRLTAYLKSNACKV